MTAATENWQPLSMSNTHTLLLTSQVQSSYACRMFVGVLSVSRAHCWVLWVLSVNLQHKFQIKTTPCSLWINSEREFFTSEMLLVCWIKKKKMKISGLNCLTAQAHILSLSLYLYLVYISFAVSPSALDRKALHLTLFSLPLTPTRDKLGREEGCDGQMTEDKEGPPGNPGLGVQFTWRGPRVGLEGGLGLGHCVHLGLIWQNTLLPAWWWWVNTEAGDTIYTVLHNLCMGHSVCDAELNPSDLCC